MDPRPSSVRSAVRTEKDLLGPKDVPSAAYYGVQTARGIENFHISGVPVSRYPELVRAIAMVKLAAARANHDLGGLDDAILRAIEGACMELIEGKLHDHFPVDMIQGGAGTTTNMNANEVIANRALELMGRSRGEYEHCSPHDHVNLSQSTNDAYPCALKLAIALQNEALTRELEELVAAFRKKGGEFSHILKMGRTQLQDAVPMTLGQEVTAWAVSLADEGKALRRVSEAVLHEVNMGGTAIGTGLNAPVGFTEGCSKHLAKITGYDITPAADLIEATQDTQAFVFYSSALKSLAIKLSKICNDLRLLSSGPRAGLHEINLPPMQPGSSIMPGKVNPVMPEVVNQVCFKVIGNDLVVTLACEAGQLQLNVMEPVVASAILESQTMLRNACRTLRANCIEGLSANEDVCRRFVEQSIGVVTALNPVLGYETSTELAAEALRSGKGIVELIKERGLLTDAQIAEHLDPRRMTSNAPRKS